MKHVSKSKSGHETANLFHTIMDEHLSIHDQRSLQLKGEVRRKMNFTYVLGFVVLRDVVKVFPDSSSSFARKTTAGNQARSHSGALREFDIFHRLLVYLSRNNNTQAQARRFPALTAPEPEFPVIFRIQVRSADECVAPGRRQPRETR